MLRSAFGALTGSLISTEPEQFFTEMSSTDFSSVPWHTLVILLTAAVLIFGVSGGIEKINKVMMPAFFILFIIIAVRVAFLPNAIEGYKYLLVPQWEYLFNPRTWIMAMGQAFFSLSITGSGMIIYGSYLPKNEDVVHSSCMTAVLDTCAAMLAGFAILPSVFAFGLDPASGPKLLFITLPRVFQQMPFGRLFAFFFFISVLFAGITSLANMLEAVSEAAQTRLKLSRKRRCPAGVRRRAGGRPVYRARYAHGDAGWTSSRSTSCRSARSSARSWSYWALGLPTRWSRS